MADGKWIHGLAPEMPVEDAARVVFAARFDVVRQYLPLAAGRPFEDPEYVHQLRVGTRRAAAAVRVFADCLAKKDRKAARAYLRGLRRAAGDARDWDVFLGRLTAGQRAAGEAAGPAFDFLLGYALGERSSAQVRLADAAAAGQNLVPEMAALPARVRRPKGDSPPRALGDLAAAHLGGLLDEFARAADANPSDPHDLHRLRILAKRVRYAMELFAGCFAPPLREALYPAVESLQETLGELQDAAVGAGRLEALRDPVRQAIPDEWPRLSAGIEGLIEEFREKIPAGREQFLAWREDWAKLTAEHPLESLRLVPATT
jgi:CHAD domain-containing protein